MKVPYYFSVLRYIHDQFTQEFVNVAVVVYAPEAGYFRALYTRSFHRVTALFPTITDAKATRRSIRHVVNTINQKGERPLALDATLSLEQQLARILPRDDSALQFSPAGTGIADDLDAALRDTFDRCVEAYAGSRRTNREDEVVWRDVYAGPLRSRRIADRLTAKTITGANNYQFEFNHAWKNHVWHIVQPVSLDLHDRQAITEKAVRWVGRASVLQASPEPFHLHLLLGRPADNLLPAMRDARDILASMPGNPEIVDESEAESFAAELQREMAAAEPGR